MTLLEAQRGAVYLAAGAALSTVFISGEIPLPVSLLAAGAYVLSYFFGERTAGKGTVPWNVGIIAVMIYLAVAVFVNQIDLVLAASIFAVLLVINRLFNRATVRDYASLHLTMLMAISGGAALSLEMAFGVAFLIFAVTATWSLTLTLLRGEIEEEARSNRITDGGHSLLSSSRFASPRFLLSIGGLALPAVGVAVVIFLLFPRVSISMWRRQQVVGNKTGFTGQVDLAGSGTIKDDPHVAFRVYTARRSGPELLFHWRGKAMDEYDGHSWHDTTHPPRPTQSLGDVYEFGHDGRDAEEFTIEIIPDPDQQSLFTTGNLQELEIRTHSGIARADPPRVWRDGEGDLSYRPAQPSEFRYTIRTLLDEPPVSGLGRDYPAWTGKYLRLPKNLDPRITALGQRLGGGKDPAEAERAITAYLSTYTYSLDITATGKDPLASFLFDVKSGHCEYFASALAILLRTAGIPTRIVSGYYGGQYISNGNYYALRQGDAHTWVEIYYPGRGWQPSDPTPVAGREARVGRVYGAFQLWMDGMHTQWRNLVVEYDLAAQVRSFRSVMDVLSDARSRMATGSQTMRLQHIGIAIAIVLTPITSVLIVVAALRRRRRKAQDAELPRTESQKRAGELYQALLGRLVRFGIAPRPSQTPLEVAAEVEARGLEQAPLVGRIIRRYLEARYGQALLEPAESSALHHDLKKI
jgi:transglutaminase-like putative cysteine protease